MFHQYSCLRCRSRKVKCNKAIPTCALCIDAGTQCVYAARRPRKSRKVNPVEGQRPLLPAENGYPSPPDTTPDGSRAILDHDQSHTLLDDSSSDDDSADIIIPNEIRDSSHEFRCDYVQSDHGRLIMVQGRSRYINSDKANEVAYLETILACEYERSKAKTISKDLPPTRSNANTSNNSLLGLSPPRRCLRTFHPPPGSMGTLWEYYVRYVDVLVKMLYKPTVKSVIDGASANLESLDASTETLLFAIWFAAVTTMSKEECLRLHKEERSQLLSRYRRALEQALAQAGWMTSQRIEILQALILYVYFAPSKNARSNWMVCGIGLGVAQAMGLHSDSALFRLGPVETEVRRRVWWALYQLDVRISDECGLDPHVPLTVNTKFPLHIDDSDLSTGDEGAIVPKSEFTEMTSTLLKVEFSETWFKIKKLKYENSPSSKDCMAEMIREKIKRLEEVYLGYFNPSIQIQHLCSLGVQLLISKLERMEYDEPKSGEEASSGTMDERLLVFNTNVLEIASQFPDDFEQFGWHFRCKYTQWHAMAYLLMELFKHQDARGPVVDRAWEVLDSFFNKPDERDSSSACAPKGYKTKVLWVPLQKLYMRIQQARNQALQIQNIGQEQGFAIPTTEVFTDVPNRDALLGDPFLGSGIDFDQNITWEQLDAWIKDYEPEFFYQDDAMDTQMDNYGGLFN